MLVAKTNVSLGIYAFRNSGTEDLPFSYWTTSGRANFKYEKLYNIL